MSLLMYLILIVPSLALLMFVHELGHFLTARWFGVKVMEFGFGFPPRLFTVRRGETLYSVNWLPLGGFVRLLGGSGAADSDAEDAYGGRRFTEQSPFRRAVVLIAGPAMNFMAALVIFTILFLLPYRVPFGVVTVGGAVPGSPAAEAGIRPGDRILAVDGERVRDEYDLLDSIRESPGPELHLGVRRGQSSEDSAARRVTVPLSQPDIGLIIARTDTEWSAERRTVPDALWSAATRTWSGISGPVRGLASWDIGDSGLDFLSLSVIAPFSSEAVLSPNIHGLALFLEIVAFLSVSLGLLNFLPIPGLDGGKLTFILIEWARGGGRASPGNGS